MEITAEEFAVKGGRNLYEDFRQANREVDEAAYDDESQEAANNGNISGNGNDGNAQVVSRQAIGEELRNDAGRSVSSIGKHVSGISDSVNGEGNIQNQPRTSPLTDREVLSMAADELANEDNAGVNVLDVNEMTPGEKDALRIFRSGLDSLRELEEKRAEEGRLQFNFDTLETF